MLRDQAVDESIQDFAKFINKQTVIKQKQQRETIDPMESLIEHQRSMMELLD